MSNPIASFDDQAAKDELRELARKTIEETINAMLDEGHHRDVPGRRVGRHGRLDRRGVPRGQTPALHCALLPQRAGQGPRIEAFPGRGHDLIGPRAESIAAPIGADTLHAGLTCVNGIRRRAFLPFFRCQASIWRAALRKI